MSTYKTKLESNTIDSFMHEHFGSDVTDIKMPAAGEASQAALLKLRLAQKSYVLVKHTDEGYRKDKFAYEHFRSPLMPIPEIEEIDTLPDGCHKAALH